MNRKSFLFKTAAGILAFFGISKLEATPATNELLPTIPPGFRFDKKDGLIPNRFAGIGMGIFRGGDWTVEGVSKYMIPEGVAIIALDEGTGEMLVQDKKTREKYIIKGAFNLKWIPCNSDFSRRTQTETKSLLEIESERLREYLQQQEEQSRRLQMEFEKRYEQNKEENAYNIDKLISKL